MVEVLWFYSYLDNRYPNHSLGFVLFHKGHLYTQRILARCDDDLDWWEMRNFQFANAVQDAQKGLEIIIKHYV